VPQTRRRATERWLPCQSQDRSFSSRDPSPAATRLASGHFRLPYHCSRLLSALVPGLGQLYTGRRRLGTVTLATTASLLLVATVTSWLGPIGLVPLLLRPSVLVGLLALNVGLALLRAGCVVDAFRSAQLRRGPAYCRHDLALCRGKQSGGPSSATRPVHLTAPALRPAG